MKAQHCAMPVSASQINLTWTDNSSGGPHNRRALTLRLESEPSHFIYLKFDEFASVQGSSKLISELRHANNRAGAEAELIVAKKYRTAGETVTELRAAAGKGNIDVVTNLKAIEVKSGNLGNINDWQHKLDNFAGQMVNLKDYATRKGISPILALSEDINKFANMKRVVDSVGGILVERF
jgi:hypothetical protein